MFEKLKRKYAHFVVRRKYLHNDIQPISFNHVLSNALDFFIIMPQEDKDFYHSLNILKYFQLHKKVITLFVPEYKYNLIPEKEKYKFISYHPKQITRINLPDKTLVGRLKDKQYDVVLDMNRPGNIFYSAISNVVRSKVRVSFKKELSERYYNMQIEDKQPDPEIGYERFLNYLKMF